MQSFLILLALALIASSCGFRKYVWFISIGYGAAIALIGVGLLAIFGGSLTVGTALQCVLLVVYGCRLAGYLIYRDVKTAYNRRMKGEVKSDEGVSVVAKVGIWVSASLLYVLQTSPILFRLEGDRGTDVLCIVGLLISAAGLVLETTADLQKNRAKKANPRRFVDTGLFRLVRCPNWRDGLLDRRLCVRDLRVRQRRPMDLRHPRLSGHHLRHVRRGAPPGDQAGQELRRQP